MASNRSENDFAFGAGESFFFDCQTIRAERQIAERKISVLVCDNLARGDLSAAQNKSGGGNDRFIFVGYDALQNAG